MFHINISMNRNKKTPENDFEYDNSSIEHKEENKEPITHKDVWEIARQNPDFIIEEKKINFYFHIANEVYKYRHDKLELSKEDFCERYNLTLKELEMIEWADYGGSIYRLVEILGNMGFWVDVKLKRFNEDLNKEDVKIG